MPSGKTHERVNFFFLNTFIIIYIFSNIFAFTYFDIEGIISTSIFFAGYIFSTYMFGPDLDVPSRPYYRWKKFRFLWKPYQKMFSHRSVWTHGVIIGDIIRIIYLLGATIPLYIGLTFLFQWNIDTSVAHLVSFAQTFDTYLISLAVGIFIASSVHIFSDVIVSGIKRMMRKIGLK